MSSHCTPGFPPAARNVTRRGGGGRGRGAGLRSRCGEWHPRSAPPHARGGTGVQASPHESRPEGEGVPFSTGQRQGADLRPTISAGPP